jgi:hypothetical protein
MRQYSVQGFPTIVFTEAAGKSLGRSGYMQGGPKVWTAKADTILAGFKGRKQDARPASADGARTDDGPDLVISSFSAVLTGPQRITYSYTITNVGTKPANLDGPTGSNADNVSVQAFMSKDTLFRNEGDLPAGGKTLGRSSSGSLRPGGTRKGRFSATVREEVAEFPYLILMVDWGKVVDESNEENNLAVIGIGKSSKKTTKR